MSKVVQLKKKAAECEQKKQYDRALTFYIQAIEAVEPPEERDIQLYNRVGDLCLRMGDRAQAVKFYEQAVDLYADGGFFSNAIALCNKVLRYAPDRSLIYYKLGKISAQKGFSSDAKQNFLEYAGRMQKAGELDEAFRALKEFADLCPGQDDVRLMLAEQLGRVGRNREALEQLQIIYDTMLSEDRQSEAAATLDRIRAIDPDFAPGQGNTRRQAKRDGLVFIDIHTETPAVQPVENLDVTQDARPADVTEAAVLPGVEFTALEPYENSVTSGSLLESDATLPQSEQESSLLAGVTPLEDPMLTLAAASAMQEESLPAALVLLPDISPEELVPQSESGPSAVLPVPSVPPSVEPVRHPIQIVPQSAPSRPSASSSDFIDLTEWLRETQPEPNPRMTAEGEANDTDTSAQQTDFTKMLETFKRGIAENVDESDTESHYDLGVAYMEMGLLTEAITQFQRVLRGNSLPERRVRAYESLGHCFVEQGDYDIARASLSAALREPGLAADTLVGVLYLLGYASELTGRWTDAEGYYKRVVAIDITFRDVNERLRRATKTAVA